MMRNKPSVTMQKTYDECYLICSTAVYFESQNNEAEALRSWRNALDQIYYHNAYRVPANYNPKSETDKALQDSLKQMELQCKERVDLLEALRKSREDADKSTESVGAENITSQPPVLPSIPTWNNDFATWLGQGTIPPVGYSDLARPPPLPKRPPLQSRGSSSKGLSRSKSSEPPINASLNPLSNLPTPGSAHNTSSRTPSPEKKTGLLRTLRPAAKEGKSSYSKAASSPRTRPPVASSKAATQAWGSISKGSGDRYTSNTSDESLGTTAAACVLRDSASSPSMNRLPQRDGQTKNTLFDSSSRTLNATASEASRYEKPLPTRSKSPLGLPKLDPEVLNYRNEYKSARANPKTTSMTAAGVGGSARKRHPQESAKSDGPPPQGTSPRIVRRKQVNTASKMPARYSETSNQPRSSESGDDIEHNSSSARTRRRRKVEDSHLETASSNGAPTPTSEVSEESELDEEQQAWKRRTEKILKRLPKGVDETAAKQIFNEIVVRGDEVHWDDVAGLEVAKSALKETVVYPFLRPDLFMGLREPARGMLLFGPPGTGKTMLARAVATESKSTFFAISASSLTSKYLGESEKLVRALFALARALAPSIIFVDEIDSLLSSRSGTGEHEATRRIKTEFLIQWSDLARAAAGREQSEKDKEKGDASRVLVLAATNLPWAIDEAARRRFVRRQYIPLPEDHVRATQLKTLLSHQKHNLSPQDIQRLVKLTDDFSGSDITALAKDAAMGPLRSLGEKLLQMAMDEIRPIQFKDFEASLINIRPSVSKHGLQQYEEWAREFGERAG